MFWKKRKTASMCTSTARRATDHWQSMPMTRAQCSPPSSTRPCCVSAATRRTLPSRKDSRKSLPPSTPRDYLAIPTTSRTARPSSPKNQPEHTSEGSNEHYAASHAPSVARGGHRLEACPGWHLGSCPQLQIVRALVEHADRST